MERLRVNYNSAFLWKREFKQPRRQRQRKRQLKSEFELFQTSLLFPFRHSFCQLLGAFTGVDSEKLSLSSEKEKENCCLVFTSSIKCETRIVSSSYSCNNGNNRIYKTAWYGFAEPIAFLPLSLPSPSLLLKLTTAILNREGELNSEKLLKTNGKKCLKDSLCWVLHDDTNWWYDGIFCRWDLWQHLEAMVAADLCYWQTVK